MEKDWMHEEVEKEKSVYVGEVKAGGGRERGLNGLLSI